MPPSVYLIYVIFRQTYSPWRAAFNLCSNSDRSPADRRKRASTRLISLATIGFVTDLPSTERKRGTAPAIKANDRIGSVGLRIADQCAGTSCAGLAGARLDANGLPCAAITQEHLAASFGAVHRGLAVSQSTTCRCLGIFSNPGLSELDNFSVYARNDYLPPFVVLEGTNFAVPGTIAAIGLKLAEDAVLVATVEWSDLAGAGGSGNDGALFAARCE